MQNRTKSRTMRRTKVRTVSGTKTRYDKRKPKLGTCPETGQTLKGVPRARPVDMRRTPKSGRRPTRPYGGVLSSEAARKKIKEKARMLE